MKLYVDSGNLEQIEKFSQIGVVDGVTTNPALIAKEGVDFKKRLKEILKILKKNCADDFTLSAEVTDLTNVESMIKQAKELSKIDKHILIKVPMTKEGLIVVKELKKLKIRTNVTLVFSASQALLAAKAGAWCVSPFVGRLNDINQDGLKLIEDTRKIFDRANIETKILAASFRTTKNIQECAIIGADIATVSPKLFENMFNHPLTDIGIDKFNKVWQEFQDEKRIP